MVQPDSARRWLPCLTNITSQPLGATSLEIPQAHVALKISRTVPLAFDL